MGGYKEDRARPFSVLSSDRTRGHRLKYKRCSLSIRKRFFTVMVSNGTGCPKRLWSVPSQTFKSQSWTACPRGPCLSRVVGQDDFTCNLSLIVWSVFFLVFRVVWYYLSTKQYQKITYLRSDEGHKVYHIWLLLLSLSPGVLQWQKIWDAQSHAVIQHCPILVLSS